MRSDIIWLTHNKKIDLNVVKEFEKKINFKFPDSYIEIVLKYNGGKIDNYIDSIDFYNNFFKNVATYEIGVFLAFESKDAMTMDWMWEHRNSDPEFPYPENIVPFAVDGGGEEFCFDYRHDIYTNEPKIVVWHHEAIPGSKEELSFVANSFDEFLDMLYSSRTEDEIKEIRNFKWSWDE